MEFLGTVGLNGTTSQHVFVICICRSPVDSGLHGDDGARAAELVFLLDGHARPFDDAPDGRFAGSVSLAVTTTGSGSLDEGGLHGEGVIRGEVLVGVELGRERLEISVQSGCLLGICAR